MGTAVLNLRTATWQQVNNQELPTGEGPRAIPLLLDFSLADTFVVDISHLEQTAKFTMLQTVFVDLSNSDEPLFITARGTNQTLIIKGRTQGYYPILAPNPTVLEVAYNPPTGGAGAGPVVTVQLINVPIMGVQWATQ